MRIFSAGLAHLPVLQVDIFSPIDSILRAAPVGGLRRLGEPVRRGSNGIGEFLQPGIGVGMQQGVVLDGGLPIKRESEQREKVAGPSA